MTRYAQKPTVFIDFDNTITSLDVIDDILLRFSMDDSWKDLEDEWKKGKIGSRKCLEGQIGGIKITKAELDKYLSEVKIDPYFKVLADFLDSKKIKLFILSDNFDYILKNVLKNNGIRNIESYANKLDIKKDRLVPSFPFTNKKCGTCAHCKTNTLLSKLDKDSSAVYIGDGLSDLHPAKAADTVYAKSTLLERLKGKHDDCIPFKTLEDVYKDMKEAL